MHPRRTLSGLAALLLIALLAACATTPVPRRIEPPAQEGRAPWGSTAELVEGQLRLKGEPLSGPALLLASADWPDDAPAPPAAAVALAGPEGRLHILASRAESPLAASAAVPLADAPKDAARPLAAAGTLDGAGALSVKLDDVQSGDRALVFAADAADARTGLLGTARYEADRWGFTAARPGAAGAVLLVRIGHLGGTLAPAAAPLFVPTPAGADACLPSLSDVRWVEASAAPADEPTPLTLSEVRCEGTTLTAATLTAPSGLLRTSLWTLTALTLDADTAPLLPALAALRAGAPEVAASLVLQLDTPTPTSRLLAAGILAEIGLLSAAQDTLGDTPGAEATRLRAAILLRLGDAAGASAALAAPGDPLLSSSVATQPLALVQALAAHLNDPAAAAVKLQAARDAAPARSPDRLSIGGAGVLAFLNAGKAPEALKLARLLHAEAATDADRLATSQLLAFSLLDLDPPTEATEHLRSAAALATTLRRHDERSRVLRLLASLPTIPPAERDTLLSDALQAAQLSRDPELIAEAAVARWITYAEDHAAEADPPPEAPARLRDAQERALAADRLDLAARSLRYGVLLLPATADIEARARAARELLRIALHADDPPEIAIAYLLLARVEAARFRYPEAEAAYDLALDFAELFGDDDLTASIEAERRELQ